MSKQFERFAAMVVSRHDDRNGERLMDNGPEVQVPYVTGRLEHFAKTTPLIPVIGTAISLAGFGEAPLHFKSKWDEYMLLSEVAESLGMPIQKAVRWAEQERNSALEDQRDLDEERGDHLLGYECMRGVVDLRVNAIIDDPEAKPDANGQRWSHTGDWLVAKDRIPSLLLSSPWSREFMDNTRDLMRHAFTSTFGGVPGFEPELTKDEAIKRARRGPVIDGGEE